MTESALLGPPRVRRRLAALADRPLNFDPATLAHASAADGWGVTDLCQPLPPEPPGEPLPDGSWQIARGLMRSYEFADPSIVRAYYDPDQRLEDRNMLLKLQALGVARLYVGVRVASVYEELRDIGGEQVRLWGWSYRTLEGHIEMGEMHWEVWKWLADGRVEFRVHALSRLADIRNPLVRLGFHLLGERERQAFLQSTKQRMLTFTELALTHDHDRESIREAAVRLTSRPTSPHDPAHDQIAGNASQQ